MSSLLSDSETPFSDSEISQEQKKEAPEPTPAILEPELEKPETPKLDENREVRLSVGEKDFSFNTWDTKITLYVCKGFL